MAKKNSEQTSQEGAPKKSDNSHNPQIVIAIITGIVAIVVALLSFPPFVKLFDPPITETPTLQLEEMNASATVSSLTPVMEYELNLVLEDDFDNPASGWATRNDDLLVSKYVNGGYQLTLKNEWIWAYQQYLGGNTQGEFDDFVVELDLTAQSESGMGGLVFRRSSDYEFYVFEVAVNGEFRLLRADQESRENWVILQNWTYSPSLVMGFGTNRLKVEAFGDRISLYSNGTLLTTIRDDTYGSGWIGLYISRSSQDYQESKESAYVFDNVTISEIRLP